MKQARKQPAGGRAVVIGVHMPAETRAALRAWAGDEHRSLSSLVNYLLTQALRAAGRGGVGGGGGSAGGGVGATSRPGRRRATSA
jgi:hypothetical protein